MVGPTTGDLIRAKWIASNDVNPAVDVFIRDPTLSLFQFAVSDAVDPAAAVKAHEPSRKAVAEPSASETFRPGMVSTANLVARAVA